MFGKLRLKSKLCFALLEGFDNSYGEMIMINNDYHNADKNMCTIFPSVSQL